MPKSARKDRGPLWGTASVLAVALVACAPANANQIASGEASDSPTPSASASASSSAWPRPGQQLTVLGIGDSVMESANCGCEGPVAEYADLLASRTGAETNPVNLGSGGLTAADLATQLASDDGLRQAVSEADVVLVTIGANDVAGLAGKWDSCPASCWTTPLATLDTSMAGVFQQITALRKNRTVPVLVTNYWNVVSDGDVAEKAYGDQRVQWSLQLTAATNQVIARETQESDFTLVDLMAPFRGSKGSDDPTGLLLDDGDHPNAAGVTVIAKSFLAATPTS